MLVKVFDTTHKYINYDDYEDFLGRELTSWEEVTEEEYNILIQSEYLVIRQVPTKEYKLTIQKILNSIKKQKEKEQEYIQKQALLDKQRAEKTLQRKLARAKKLLEQHGS